MCLAIPYGRKSPSDGTRLGRWLRTRPAHMSRLAGAYALANGPFLLAIGPERSWPWVLRLTQGLAALVLAVLLEGLPRRCGVSEVGSAGCTLACLSLALLAAVTLTTEPVPAHA